VHERPNRASSCKICLSPNLAGVNEAIGNNLGLLAIVSMFGGQFSRSSIYRHSLHADIKKAQPVTESTNRARELRSRVETLLAAAEQRGDIKTAATLISRLVDLDNKILDVSPERQAPPKVTLQYYGPDGESYDPVPYISAICTHVGWRAVLEKCLQRMAEHVEMGNVSPELAAAGEKFLDALLLDREAREKKESEKKQDVVLTEIAGPTESIVEPD